MVTADEVAEQLGGDTADLDVKAFAVPCRVQGGRTPDSRQFGIPKGHDDLPKKCSRPLDRGWMDTGRGYGARSGHDVQRCCGAARSHDGVNRRVRAPNSSRIEHEDSVCCVGRNRTQIQGGPGTLRVKPQPMPGQCQRTSYVIRAGAQFPSANWPAMAGIGQGVERSNPRLKLGKLGITIIRRPRWAAELVALR